jgi:hypothetical protein
MEQAIAVGILAIFDLVGDKRGRQRDDLFIILASHSPIHFEAASQSRPRRQNLQACQPVIAFFRQPQVIKVLRKHRGDFVIFAVDQTGPAHPVQCCQQVVVLFACKASKAF